MKKTNQSKLRRFLLKENLMWNNPLVAGALLAPSSIPGFLYNTYQIGKNRYNTSGDQRAKVLIFDEPLTEWQSVMLGVKGAVARFFTGKNVRVDYKHNAKSDDLREVLENERYQNIVVMGHGGRSCWCARDGVVYAQDVENWMDGLQKKKGYFIQFTCGNEQGKPLGYGAVEDSAKLLGFTKSVDLGDRLASLWGESSDGIKGLATLTWDK